MKLNRDTWIKIGSWVLILLIAPFFAEIALVAEIVGVDVAVAMLFLYYSAFTTALRTKIDDLNTLVFAALRTPVDRLAYFNKSLCWNTALSGLIFWVGGSLSMLIILWSPVFMVASRVT
ncbi:MAG: hypothetical protein AAGH76_11245 [Pseudomonadota bacterium]